MYVLSHNNYSAESAVDVHNFHQVCPVLVATLIVFFYARPTDILHTHCLMSLYPMTVSVFVYIYIFTTAGM